VARGPIAVAVSLADKLDTLIGFWAIDEKPTGSKDPFALRRATLGVIRTILQSGARVPLKGFVFSRLLADAVLVADLKANGKELSTQLAPITELFRNDQIAKEQYIQIARQISQRYPLIRADYVEFVNTSRDDLVGFFADRLKVQLKDKGVKHDYIDAVFALDEDDLVLIVKRVEALGEFLATEDGKNLLAGYKRAANILTIEEKKDGKSYSGQGKAIAGDPPEVDALVSALTKAAPEADAALAKEDFAGAMRALSKLRGPVDAFFDKVTVNADDAAARANRLTILSQIRDALGRVADFSKIEG